MVGLTVDLRPLHALWFSSQPYAHLEASAGRLAASGLLHRVPGERCHWRFANAMERDIVYGLMPAGQRRRLHLQLARVRGTKLLAIAVQCFCIALTVRCSGTGRAGQCRALRERQARLRCQLEGVRQIATQSRLHRCIAHYREGIAERLYPPPLTPRHCHRMFQWTGD